MYPLKLRCPLGGGLENRTLGFASPTFTCFRDGKLECELPPEWGWGHSASMLCSQPHSPNYCEWLGSPNGLTIRGVLNSCCHFESNTGFACILMLSPPSEGISSIIFPIYRGNRLSGKPNKLSKPHQPSRGQSILCDMPLTSFDPAIPFLGFQRATWVPQIYGQRYSPQQYGSYQPKSGNNQNV